MNAAEMKWNETVAPRIRAPEYTTGVVGMSVDIKCTVNAKPVPKVIFWRDHDGRIPVILGNNYRMKIDNDTEVRNGTSHIELAFDTSFLFSFCFYVYVFFSFFSPPQTTLSLHIPFSAVCCLLAEAIWWYIYVRACANQSECVGRSVHGFLFTRAQNSKRNDFFFLFLVFSRCEMRDYITRNY